MKTTTKEIKNMIAKSRKRFVSLTGGVVSACLKTKDPMQSLTDRYLVELKALVEMQELAETPDALRLVADHSLSVCCRYLEAYKFLSERG